MQHSYSKHAVLAAALIVAGAYAGSTAAHTQYGALGKPATATDIYQATCLDDGNGTPHHLVIQVIDLPPVKPPQVSVQASKGGVSVTTTDKKDGDSVYSPAATLNGGAGAYTLKVYKSAAGSEVYTFVFHCVTSANVHTGTDISVIQNQ